MEKEDNSLLHHPLILWFLRYFPIPHYGLIIPYAKPSGPNIFQNSEQIICWKANLAYILILYNTFNKVYISTP